MKQFESLCYSRKLIVIGHKYKHELSELHNHPLSPLTNNSSARVEIYSGDVAPSDDSEMQATGAEFPAQLPNTCCIKHVCSHDDTK